MDTLMEQLESRLPELLAPWERWQAEGSPDDFEALIAPLAELTGEVQDAGLHQMGEILEVICVLLMDAQETGDRPPPEWFMDVISVLLELADRGGESDEPELLDAIATLTGCGPDSTESAPGAAGDQAVDDATDMPGLPDPPRLTLQPESTVSADVWRAFLEDTPRHLEVLREGVLALSPDAPVDASVMHALERASHTIKGASALVGVTAISQLAHALEDRFEAVKQEGEALGQAQSDLLVEAVDTLESLFEALETGAPVPSHVSVLIGRLRGQNVPDACPETDTPQQTEAARSAHRPGPLHQAGLEGIRMLAEELGVNAVRARELLRRLQADMALAQLAENQLDEARYELEKLVDTRSMARVSRPSVGEGRFDALEMDEYDALHLMTRHTSALLADMREKYGVVREHLGLMDTLIRQQSRQVDRLQSEVMDGYREPLSRLTPRLARCVRQAARSCGKQARLAVEGDEIRVDRQLLDQLAEPLMHLLRNAVDHGLNETGTVSVRYRLAGHRLCITVTDDGPGVDLVSLRARITAHEPAAGAWDDETVLATLWRPGFSTRDQVTELSGRGIGMDAVRQAVLALGGRASLSQPGQGGLVVELEVPLQRMTEYMLVVEAGGRAYALRSRDIYRVLPPDQRTLISLGEQYVWTEEGEDWVGLDLGLRLSGQPAPLTETCQALVLIREAEGQYALAVDRVLMGEQLSLRPLPESAPPLPGLAGLAVQGDGSLIPVLQPYYWCGGQRRVASGQSQPQRQRLHRRTVLVVDDSGSVRSTLRELLQDTGYNVITAGDGAEALKALETGAADVVLTDLEMPVMDGLTLTTRLRRESRHAGLPVIMLTSRNQPHHRSLAQEAGVNAYLTKPFDEDQLLDTLEEMLACTSQG
ncbi:MAG: hybrid sensor histidine kinase/response regulator [Gammaproteobacteria bacterium]|nr:MAG: hybrid sensor histidine kinase/response regulator [Gammaproteobacteria bacterium]